MTSGLSDVEHGPDGEPLPSLAAFKVAKHTKGNAQGVKLDAQALRLCRRVSSSPWERLGNWGGRLFGMGVEEENPE